MIHLTCVVRNERSTSSRWQIVGLWMAALLALPVASTAAPPAPSDATPADRLRMRGPTRPPRFPANRPPTAQVLTGPGTRPSPSRSSSDPRPGLIAPKAPPQAIEELAARSAARGCQCRMDSRLLELG